MINVAVIDDERLIREGIASTVEWTRLGCRMVGIASDGRQGLDLIREKKPTLVITDIRMPGMSGLEMIRETQKYEWKPHYIILSGYDDFTFARKAMEYGVRHYLLKPLDEKELEEKILLIVSEFRAQRREKLTGNSCVDRIVEYLEFNYARRDLSLGWIADNLIYKNCDHLGRLFKKHTGIGFQCYLNRLRIGKARLILDEGRGDKIYEVAEQCGFPPDGQYFSTQFKKNTGMSPREYGENR
jgi:two-component system, response regulator YesN